MKRVPIDTNKNLTLKLLLCGIMLAVSFALAVDVQSKMPHSAIEAGFTK